jgi:anti-anti-sigma factor
MANAGARYTEENGTWFVQLNGDVRHPLGPALNALLDRAFAAPGTSRFLIDLSRAETIDSTCLGILARIANWSRDKDVPRSIIVTGNEDIAETLRSVCFDRLFDLRAEPGVDTGPFAEVAPADADAQQMASLVLEAHQRLCALDARNAAVFRDLVELLEREAARAPPRKP